MTPVLTPPRGLTLIIATILYVKLNSVLRSPTVVSETGGCATTNNRSAIEEPHNHDFSNDLLYHKIVFCQKTVLSEFHFLSETVFLFDPLRAAATTATLGAAYARARCSCSQRATIPGGLQRGTQPNFGGPPRFRTTFRCGIFAGGQDFSALAISVFSSSAVRAGFGAMIRDRGARRGGRIIATTKDYCYY
jgi:hypothetical protein